MDEWSRQVNDTYVHAYLQLLGTHCASIVRMQRHMGWILPENADKVQQ